MTRALHDLRGASCCSEFPPPGRSPPHLPPLDRALPPRAETIYQQLAARVDPSVAMDVVTFMAPLWRLAGNPAFEQSQQQIFDRLAAAGLRPRYETFANPAAAGSTEGHAAARRRRRARSCCRATRIASRWHQFVHHAGRRRDAAAGRRRRRHDRRRPTTARTSRARWCWRADRSAQVFAQAVRSRGAAGVISSDVAPYTRPDETPDVLQWGSIPSDEALRSFGFKATPRAGGAACATSSPRAPVTVHVEIESTFHRRPNRTLVGRDSRAARTGASASCWPRTCRSPARTTTPAAAARCSPRRSRSRTRIRRGALPPPARTLTFLWVDEIRGSEQWIKDDADRASKAWWRCCRST